MQERNLGTGSTPSTGEESQEPGPALAQRAFHLPFLAEKHAEGCLSSCCMNYAIFCCICCPVGACEVCHTQANPWHRIRNPPLSACHLCEHTSYGRGVEEAELSWGLKSTEKHGKYCQQIQKRRRIQSTQYGLSVDHCRPRLEAG